MAREIRAGGGEGLNLKILPRGSLLTFSLIDMF